MITQPKSKLLYIAHLAERLDAMESGRVPISPRLYRLAARRLRQAIAGCSEAWLARELAARHPQVAEMLEVRYFNDHGRLGPGAAAAACSLASRALLERLLRP